MSDSSAGRGKASRLGVRRRYQVVVRTTHYQERVGDAGDGSHEGVHSRHWHETLRCAHHEKVDWTAGRQTADVGTALKLPSVKVRNVHRLEIGSGLSWPQL